MNMITTVLATGQISVHLVVIDRRSGSSLTLLVGRLTTSDSPSLSREVFGGFCEILRRYLSPLSCNKAQWR